MGGRKVQHVSDQILERYLEEYAQAEPSSKHSRTHVQATIVRSLTRYLKKKAGGLAAHAEILSPLILDLELQLCTSDLADFMFVSETISLAKKFIRIQKGEYAGGFKRALSPEERYRSKTLLEGVASFQSEDTKKEADSYSYD